MFFAVLAFFFFSSRRRHTRCSRDWSSDVCSSDLGEIPANTYKGQEREVATASVMAMLVARSALSEDLMYRFIKAVFDNLPQLYAAHAAARNLTVQTALAGMPLPLHRGAERFFKEKGISRE